MSYYGPPTEEKSRPKLQRSIPSGAYKGYYTCRYAAEDGTVARDPRLALLDKTFFTGKRCLDIGCNSGLLTLAIARMGGPAVMIGVDIDAALISQARHQLALAIKEVSRPLPGLVPRTVRQGATSAVSMAGVSKTESNSLKNVRFETYDISSNVPLPCFHTPPVDIKPDVPAKISELGKKAGRKRPLSELKFSEGADNEISSDNRKHKKGKRESDNVDVEIDSKNGSDGCIDSFSKRTGEIVEAGEGLYDVVMAFSVIKWIHLEGGDAVVKMVFQKIYAGLVPGGRFIFEMQPWRSYSRNKNGTHASAKNFSEIQLKPNDFREYLLGEEVGFRECIELGKPEGVTKGFSRPIFMYIK